MATHSDTVNDGYGRPIEGVSVYVYNPDDSIATTTPAVPLTTDTFGRYSFTAADNVYSIEYRFAGTTQRVDDVIVGDPPQYVGPTGPSNNTRIDLADLKAAAVTDKTSLYDGSLWTQIAGNFTGQADDALVVQSNGQALTTGALVRDRSQGVSLFHFLPESLLPAIFARTTTADMAPYLTAAVNRLSALGGGELYVPAGKYRLLSTVTIPLNVSICGASMGWTKITGPAKGTVFEAAHNDHAFRSTAPINDYTPAMTTLRDFAVYCVDPNASTGAAFYDQGGSYGVLERLFIHGFKYGLILDQTEQIDISRCVFFEQKHSGIWFVNGPDLNVGADLGFTNRISVTGCEFNQPVKFGIMDDGGLSKDFRSNNYNGCGVASLRLAGFCNVLVSGGESEFAGQSDIIIARKSYNTPVRDVGAMQTVKVENLFTTEAGGPAITIEDAGTGAGTVIASLNAQSNHFRGTSGPVIAGAQYATEIHTAGNVRAGFTSLLDAAAFARTWQSEGVTRTSAAWNPPAVANGATESAQFAIPGLKMGDRVDVTFSTALGAGVQLYASVASAGTVQVSLRNDSGAGIDLNGTLYFTVYPGTFV